MLAHLPSSLRRTELKMILRLIILRGAIFAAAGVGLLQMGALAQSGKIYRVGLISVGAPDNGILGPGMVLDFAKRGYPGDRNIVFQRRPPTAPPDRLPCLPHQRLAGPS